MADRIRVAVVYADPKVQIEKWVDVPLDSTAGEVIAASGIADSLPAGFTPTAIGIYGRIVDEHHRVRDGDRIELYRPLQIDPKEARRQRASR
jgi:putative ubiquitin-RnfH superfamily antitoxin RatB of RatAB toxin-antitoxin module